MPPGDGLRIPGQMRCQAYARIPAFERSAWSFALLRMKTRALGSTSDFRQPPADSYEEEAPIVEEFWRLAFEGVADELENPSEEEKKDGVKPEAMKKDARDKEGYGNKDGGDAERVAGAIDGVLMTGGVLGNPLFIGAVAEHEWDHTPVERLT